MEDSRKLWQFYWDMADEENWIKEKEQIVSVDDIGHDLTTGIIPTTVNTSCFLCSKSDMDKESQILCLYSHWFSSHEIV